MRLQQYGGASQLQGDLPGSSAGEMYEHLAAHLVATRGARSQLLVTSAHAKAGKSTTAANLALALLPKVPSVLLLELTTTPTLQQTFGESPFMRGPEDVIRGEAAPNDVICRLRSNGLYLSVMLRRTNFDFTRKEAVNRLRALLKYAAQICSWTVVDGPSWNDHLSYAPLLRLLPDPLVVLHQRHTRRSQVRAVLSGLSQQKPCVVLNEYAGALLNSR